MCSQTTMTNNYNVVKYMSYIYYCNDFSFRSQDSSVSKRTRLHRLENRQFESWWDKRFLSSPKRPEWLSGPPSFLLNATGILSWSRVPRAWEWTVKPFSAKAESKWKHSSIPLHTFIEWRAATLYFTPHDFSFNFTHHRQLLHLKHKGKPPLHPKLADRTILVQHDKSSSWKVMLCCWEQRFWYFRIRANRQHLRWQHCNPS